MTTTLLRFNMASASSSPGDRSRMHATMLDLCAAADAAGVDELTFSEHHATANRSTTSPIVLAAAALARTAQVRVSISALLLPLADPVRVAEDLATLDVAFPGRLRVVVALGYRPEEYALFGKPFADRGALMDAGLATLLATLPALAPAEPAPEGGHIAPHSGAGTPGAPGWIAVGGQSVAAARRAVRFGLPFAPRSHMPELRDRYLALAAEAGVEARCWMPAARFVQVHVAADPQRAWAIVGPRYLEDAQEYARWQGDGPRSPVFTAAGSADELRRSGAVEVVTPEECLAQVGEDPDTALCLHPLAGGMPDDEARTSVDLFLQDVLPHLPRGARP